jgi:hypothetical protein
MNDLSIEPRPERSNGMRSRDRVHSIYGLKQNKGILEKKVNDGLQSVTGRQPGSINIIDRTYNEGILKSQNKDKKQFSIQLKQNRNIFQKLN